MVASQPLPGTALWGASVVLIGFSLLAALWLAIMIGGLWFSYWIRQEGLQLTHIVLLAVTVLVAAVTCD